VSSAYHAGECEQTQLVVTKVQIYAKALLLSMYYIQLGDMRSDLTSPYL